MAHKYSQDKDECHDSLSQHHVGSPSIHRNIIKSGASQKSHLAALEALSAARELLRQESRSASICDKRWRPRESRKEPNRLRVRVWRRTWAEIPSASRAGEPLRRQRRSRGRHPQATKRLRRITGTKRFEVHQPLWPEAWRCEIVSEARAGPEHQLRLGLLSYCLF